MKPLIENNETLIYIDEMSCCMESQDGPKIISILVACSIFGLMYYNIQEGFYDRVKFYHILKEFIINLRQS